MNTSTSHIDLERAAWRRAAALHFAFWILLLWSSPVCGLQVALLTDSERPTELSPEVAEAYRFAAEMAAKSEVISFDKIVATPGMLGEFDAVWWHHADEPGLPEQSTSPIAIEAIRAFVHAGGGLLLTGFAPSYVGPLGLSPAPTRVTARASFSGAWGVAPRTQHPVFAGLGDPLLLVSSGIPIANRLCWWDQPSDFAGHWLGDVERREDVIALGELSHGAGRVLVVGIGAFVWHTEDAINLRRSTLEQFTENLMAYVSGRPTVDSDREPEETWPTESGARWQFDDDTPESVFDSIANRRDHLASYVRSPSRRPGVEGKALEFDGYSTYVVGPDRPLVLAGSGFSAGARLAIREYPTDDCAVISQRTADAGFAFGFDEAGRVWAIVHTADGPVRIRSTKTLPLECWLDLTVHVTESGSLTLRVNGETTASSTDTMAEPKMANGTHLLIGRDNLTGHVAGMFATGFFNGLIDEAWINGGIATQADAAERLSRLRMALTPNLSIGDRFAADHLRPVYHAMPTHAWTNEPHGLIRFQDRYHLNYQANPAGPYWSRIRWGHLVSDDLVHWEQRPTLLRSTPDSFDQVGMWSGCSLEREGKLYLFYTGVDGRKAAIGLAISEDGRVAVKHPDNPLIPQRPLGNFGDFRDPFIWSDPDGEWQMLVGGAERGVGGTLFHYTSDDLISWTYQGRPFSGSNADSGRFWEMPVLLPVGERHLLVVCQVPGKALYWVGHWDGDVFTADHAEPRQVDLLNHMLSPTITTDEDSELVAIGIVPETRDSSEQFAAGWAHTYSLPRRWTLGPDGLLIQSPHPNLHRLRGAPVFNQQVSLNDETHSLGLDGAANAYELELSIHPHDADEVGLSLLVSPCGRERTDLVYRPASGTITIDRSQSSLTSYGLPADMEVVDVTPSMSSGDGTLQLRVFVDRSIIEVFVNEREAFAIRAYPSASEASGAAIFALGGRAEVTSLAAWPLRAAPVTAVDNRP